MWSVFGCCIWVVYIYIYVYVECMWILNMGRVYMWGVYEYCILECMMYVESI